MVAGRVWVPTQKQSVQREFAGTEDKDQECGKKDRVGRGGSEFVGIGDDG